MGWEPPTFNLKPTTREIRVPVLTSKSQAVMNWLPSQNQDAGRTVTFVIADDDTGVIRRTLILGYGDWESFGSPDRITVTVAPGDELNQEDEQ